jgi:hypothetical protein
MIENRSGVLNPKALRVVGEAFDRAWDVFLKRGELTPKNLHSSRSRLAQLILEEAKKGDLNPHLLARSAVARLRHGDHADG